MPSAKTILFFSPHPDDEVISAGALLATLAKSNKVIVYFAENSPKGVARNLPDDEKVKIRQEEAINSCKVLGTTAKFLNLDHSLKVESEFQNNLNIFKTILEDNKPSLVLTIYENDAHPTHQKVSQLVKKSVANKNIPLCFGEVWTPILQPNDAFFFNDDLMEIKLKAITEYKSQLERTNWAAAIKGLNSYRAITLKETLGGFGSSSQQKGKYAEAFLLSK